jgi:dTDP-4-amino-4,6-dideoxygalactose transaminase
LLALGIGPGDEVIVPANTYIATAFAVSHTGAKPVFVDPNPYTYVIDTDSLTNAITNKTKAIMPVHLYGQPVDMEEMMLFAKQHNLFVIEDCAQSAGASFLDKKTGAWGDVGCFSFYPTKNLGGIGQGGAIITDNEQIADTVRELGNVGRAKNSWFDYIHKGFNSRLDAINASFLSKCLTMLDQWNDIRINSAAEYEENLDGVDIIKPPMPTETTSPVFHLYEIKCKDMEIRDNLKTYLTKQEIGTGLHYPVPCHRQPVYSDNIYNCPISNSLSDTLLSLPMHPMLTYKEIKYVCEKIKEFFNKQTT